MRFCRMAALIFRGRLPRRGPFTGRHSTFQVALKAPSFFGDGNLSRPRNWFSIASPKRDYVMAGTMREETKILRRYVDDADFLEALD